LVEAGIREDRAMSETRNAGPMTIEAIERDPWNAIRLDIPEAASAELLEHARNAAARQLDELRNYIEYDRESFDDPAFEQIKAAARRIGDLDARLEMAPEARVMSETRNAEPPSLTPEVAGKVRDTLEVWEAWQQREFSAATIAADPWTAVYLPIPQNADASLLAAAQVAAVTCVGMVELGEQWYRPRVPQGDGPAENQAKAESRLDELDARLAVLTANENSPERIALVAVQGAAPTPETARAETRDEIEPGYQGRPDPYSDQAAGRAYDQHVAQAWEHPTAEGRDAFIQDWGQAREEDRQAAIEAAYERGDLGNRSAQPDNTDAKASEINSPGYSRWTGEPLGEAAGVGQSTGKGQSPR
jgi:hypothetical protein